MLCTAVGGDKNKEFRGKTSFMYMGGGVYKDLRLKILKTCTIEAGEWNRN